MLNVKQIFFITSIFVVTMFLCISCDTEKTEDEEEDNLVDYSGLLAEYADKVVVPALEELPAFTAEMGIPVRDSIEAEIIYNAMLQETRRDSSSVISIYLGVADHVSNNIRHYLDRNDITGNQVTIQNINIPGTIYFFGDIYCFEYYSYFPENFFGDAINFNSVRIDPDLFYSYPDVTIYKGSLINFWNLRRYGNDTEEDHVVDRAAGGYIVSNGGFCAKIIVDFTYFLYGDFRGEGSVRVYGAGDEELYMKKLTSLGEFRYFTRGYR